MKLHQLKHRLGLESGRLTTNQLSITAAIAVESEDSVLANIPAPEIAAVFDTFYDGGPLTISEPVLESASNPIVITGTANFLASDLEAEIKRPERSSLRVNLVRQLESKPVRATFELTNANGSGDDVEGTLEITLEFLLVGDAEVQGFLPTDALPPWTFATSFPHLPNCFDASIEDEADQRTALHHFETGGELTEARFVLRSHTGAPEGAAPESGITLHSGLNFAGRWKAGSLLGLFEDLTSADEPLEVHGPITLPDDVALPPLEFGVLPWQIGAAIVPGIHLQVDLGITPDFRNPTEATGSGSMHLSDTKLRIYSPLHVDWLNNNVDYEPAFAYEGTITIPSAEAEATVTAQKWLGDDSLALTGQFSDTTLDDLTTALVDLAGAEDVSAMLPASATRTQGSSLEFERLAIHLEPNEEGQIPPYRVTESAFIIKASYGWSLFDKLIALTIESLAISVTDPFNTARRNLSAYLGGTLRLGSFDFALTVGAPDFFISAEQTDSAAISLNDLFDSHFGDGSRPPSISVTDFTGIVVPGDLWEFSMWLAPDGSWPPTSAGANFTIPKLHVAVTNRGWHFEGGTADDAPGVPLFDLLSQLADEIPDFSFPNWEALGNVTLDDFSLSEEGGSFSFAGEGSFPLGPTDDALGVRIGVRLESGTFSGHLTLYEMTFSFRSQSVGENSSLLVATYDGDESFEIGGLSLVEFANQFVPGVEIDPGTMDFDMAPNRAVLAYQNGAGLLLSLDMGSLDDLSSLPVVGEYLEEYEVTLGYRIVVASVGFDNTQVRAINDSLPDGFTTLPEGESDSSVAIGRGLNLLATIDLGGKPIQLLTDAGDASPSSDGASADDGAGDQPAEEGEASSLESSVTWLPIQRSMGPLYFSRIGFEYEDGKIGFLLDASITMAALTFSLRGLAVRTSLAAFEPELALEGLGLSYRNGPMTISGMFLRRELPAESELLEPAYEFAGSAVIKAKTFSITAFGAYRELDGDPSMFLYAFLDKPLGGPSFFYVTGLALGFGYNRDLTVPAIGDVESFPLVVAAQKPEEFSGTEAMLTALAAGDPPLAPAKVGAYWVAAGVRFSSFQLIHSFALLLVKFGRELDIALMGISTLRLPKEAGTPAYLYAELQFKVSVKPAAGLFRAEAQLTENSYLVDPGASLRGGFAFYLWFAEPTDPAAENHNGDFVLTLGGYHPDFLIPAHYPRVPAVTINWPIPKHNLSIKGGVYFALTPSCVMAGGTLEAVYDTGVIWASFAARLNLLINWKPFFYDVDLHLTLQVRATLETPLGPVSMGTSLSADLHIWGPEFAGTAHVEWFVVSFDIAFGDNSTPATPRLLRWHEFDAAYLPQEADGGNICGVNISSGLRREIVENATTGEKAWLVDPDELVLVTETAIPATRIALLSAEGAAEGAADGVEKEVLKGASIGLRPVGNGSVRSTHQIGIVRVKPESNKISERLELTDWLRSDSGRRQGVPAEIWNPVNTGASPGPSAEILPGALLGLDGLRPGEHPDPFGGETPDFDLATFKFDPLTVRPVELEQAENRGLAQVFVVTDLADPFHAAEPTGNPFDLIETTAGDGQGNRTTVFEVARAAGFSLSKEIGELDRLPAEARTAFKSEPMLGFLGSGGARPSTVKKVDAIPAEAPKTLRETAVRFLAYLFQYRYAAAGAVSDTAMGGHVLPPPPGTDRATFTRSDDEQESEPETFAAAAETGETADRQASPSQELSAGQSQLWQLEPHDPDEALQTALWIENSQGQRVRIVLIDQYSRLLEDRLLDGSAEPIEHPLDKRTARVLVTGLAVEDGAAEEETPAGEDSSSPRVIGWHGSSTLIQMRPRVFVGDDVMVRTQASRIRRQATDSGADILDGASLANQNVELDGDGRPASGWIRTYLPAGREMRTLAVALKRSELTAAGRANTLVQVTRGSGPQAERTQLQPLYLIRESESEIVLLYRLPEDLRPAASNTHTVLTRATAGWQIDGVMGISDRPQKVRAAWSDAYRLRAAVTQTADAPAKEEPARVQVVMAE